jgi:hypothetical protein
VGAPAQLTRPAPEINHAHVRRVRLIDQRDRATRAGVGEWHERDGALEIAPDALVDAVLDIGQLFGGERPGEREVERGVVRSDERPALHDPIAQDLA